MEEKINIIDKAELISFRLVREKDLINKDCRLDVVPTDKE